LWGSSPPLLQTINLVFLSKKILIFIFLIFLTLLVSLFSTDFLKSNDFGWALKFPKSLIFPFKLYISSSIKWLIESATFGIFTFNDLTRSISWIIEQPYEIILSFFAKGFYKGQGSQAILILSPLSWIAMVGIMTIVAIKIKDLSLALLTFFAFLYLVIFDQWQSSMVTLASIFIAVPFGVSIGMFFGILSYKSLDTYRVVNPILNLMQTMPVFAYLVPILVLFGFGPVSALIATIIYALPPMVHTTYLGLKGINPAIVEAGKMCGCSNRQLLWKVEIPSALNSIKLGINQVIMLSFNMVIIASMIGAGGLGYDVLTSLRKLDIGGGVEAGLAIVILAIVLDRMSFAYIGKHKKFENKNLNFFKKYFHLLIIIFLILITYIFGFFIDFLKSYPENITLSTSAFWEKSIKFINVNYYDQLEIFKFYILKYFMLPIKSFFLSIPWPWFIFILVLLGWYYGKSKLALLNLILLLFIVVNGLWLKAMVTIYLCGASVILACIIGIPLGIWGGLNDRANRILSSIMDTLQTLPSFVYLIPVVMLFRVGDFTAMLAVILYSLAPAVKYTIHGIRGISSEIIDAGVANGCNKRQLLFNIRLPLALPEILLGINQTIMLALSMLVITALVGTRELGQEVYIALTKADIGRGLVAGLCVAFIAIISDNLIKSASKKLKVKYGFA
jgi:glycine betaine/proline transport system permease protein